MAVQKILVTGCAGFIGFHLSKLLLNDGYEVLGIDNLNNYYHPKLKLARLNQLKPYKNFKFEKIDIADRNSITRSFRSFKPKKVVNLAAQPGVRYSLENPYAYMDANLIGFLNIIELCRHNDIAGFIYASSSSVYGGNTKIPFSVDDRVDKPLAFYGATKRANELIAYVYSHLYGLHTTGLRFFTVYGPWGRPDMAMYIFTRKILAGIPIQVFNHGNMKRDFTFIDDIVEGIVRVADNIAKSNPNWDSTNPEPATSTAPYRLYNIGNNSPVGLIRFIELIEMNLEKKSIKNFLPLQPGDVPETYANVNKLMDDIGYSPSTSIETGIEIFINWYKDYYKV